MCKVYPKSHFLQFLISNYTRSALQHYLSLILYFLLEPMFKYCREDRPSSHLAAPSLRLIDEDCLSCRVRKDLFEELLDEGDRRRHSPDSVAAAAKQREYEKMECEGERQQSEHPGCKCTKIDCLKLYCECFAKGRLCNRNCICTGCQNHPENCHSIYHAQQVANYRNPGHFVGVPAFVPAKRCTCKKSSCRKNYCQCFRAGVKCGTECECVDCHNGTPCHRDHSSPYQWMEVEKRIEISSTA